MAKLSKEKVAALLGAKSSEAVSTPFYYAPPFLDELRRTLQERLASSGGRPTVPEWEVVRKTRYSRETWDHLTALAREWSSAGCSVSASQIASLVVEQFERFLSTAPEETWETEKWVAVAAESPEHPWESADPTRFPRTEKQPPDVIETPQADGLS